MTAKKNISALTEVNGVDQPEAVSSSAARNLVSKRQRSVSAQDLINGIFDGNITALSRAITLVESTNPEHQQKASEVISACLPKANNSVRIGITGVPGVGKSTFIEAFGKYLTGIGKKVAVLAVDPSSSLSHGSILGDKTRMEELVKDKNAFIRPSASGETLGGVARKTRETITLCEAFGFDTIIIETVGVGQSETAVHGMTDFFLLLQIAGAGDELQGIKRGIMEMADAIVINKADGDNIKKAKLAKTEFGRALHYFPQKSSGWMPTALTCSAITKDGIPEIWEIVSAYLTLTKENGYFEKRRSEQNLEWMHEAINEQLKLNFYNDGKVASTIDNTRKNVMEHRLSPFSAAQELLKLFLGK
ncbi:methylmalonyl Co-A mutase-associated GTPase MeaB [Flavobacterium agri]|uniref:methylmalonyl Co-A mutase-associated GTPase MeaB n=1 Tax=Flavobacterium agri TaxID=2743471 RepID=UPI001FE7C3B2|nr:methylmalonyl Co-A mutase-associated GTPase MeaB [Flavobacterium agri]